MRRLLSNWPVLVLGMALAACQTPPSDAPPADVPANKVPANKVPEASTTSIGPMRQDLVLAPSAAPSATLLTRLTPEDTGIVHQNYLSLVNSGQYLHAGAGVAAGDYDLDGRPDLYLVSEEGQNRLYHNLGGWKFEDVTARAGVDIKRDVAAGRWKKRFPTGALFFDADTDGDPDLYVMAFAGANTLFRNNGDGTFTDITETAGVGYVGASTTATAADYDRDGDMDFYVATYRPYGNTKFYPPGSNTEPEPDLVYDYEPLPDGTHGVLPELDLLYRNNGDGTFTNVADEAGVGKVQDWGLAAVFGDLNGDGWADLYVANDYDTPDRLYLNLGNGKFQLLDASTSRHSPYFSMGMDFGDINNDGRLDYMTSDMLSPNRARRQVQTMENLVSGLPKVRVAAATQLMRNSLFLNQGDFFSDIAPYAGVMATDWTWTVKFADLDLDGWQDILITNGFINDSMNADQRIQIAALKQQGKPQEAVEVQRAWPRLLTPNVAYRNLGDLRFSDESKAWGFNDEAIAHGAALADLDGDGDQDVVVNNMNAPVGVYRNDATAKRLKVVVRGVTSNRVGIGTHLVLTSSDGKQQMREVSLSGGYMSSHEPVAVFGLGEGTGPWKLTADWPMSGQRVELADVTANQVITLTEPAGQTDRPMPAKPKTQFEEQSAPLGLVFKHQESGFDDFGRVPLIPWRLSRFGPGVAWGDQDGDGFEDLYVAGGAGQPGGLFVSKGGTVFAPAGGGTAAGAGLEEQAPLWWPKASGADLLVSLSQWEAPPGGTHPLLRRQSNGEVAAASADLPSDGLASPGALAAADYNGDGFLDLFVAARTPTSRYPQPAASWLLQGSAAGLAPAPVDAMPTITLGLVTGALWSDVDGDGDPDLLLANEWGPLRLLRNENGKLRDDTEAAGLAGRRGWWQGLASGDVDHDGDMDVVATNMGLNTDYHASKEAPVVLLAGDMDGTGGWHLIEGEWDGGKLYPRRQAQELARVVPNPLTHLPSFQAFSAATIEDVFGADRVKAATRFEMDSLEHVLLVNDGTGKFTAQPLPTEAQLTTGFGVSLADLDNDGNLDIYLVGNFYSAEPMHAGQWDSGLSVWLRGKGDGTFTAVPPAESGLVVAADAKGLAAADFDHDGWVDFAVGVNNGPLKVFHNGGVAGRQGLPVRLKGKAGNPGAIGAVISLTRADGVKLSREVQAGGSFLSQNGTVQVFGLGEQADRAGLQIQVRWPDGKTQTVPAAGEGVTEVVQAP